MPPHNSCKMRELICATKPYCVRLYHCNDQKLQQQLTMLHRSKAQGFQILNGLNSCVVKTIRILLADDHKVVRHGTRALLSKMPEWEIVGEVDNGRDAVSLTENLSRTLSSWISECPS